ncbi:MAG: cytochrome c maturation protein CcmE [Planctomycetota bacterium]|jgi:cytochrome c-type biogenesis protein CcmE
MKKKTVVKIVVGVVLIGGSMAYFVYQAMQSSYAYYYSVDDLAGRQSPTQNQSWRIAGRVQKGSVQRNIEKMNLAFNLAGAKVTLPVSYQGVVPDNFTEDVEVVVEGHLTANGTFEANKVMTRCESKYKAKVK